MEWIILFKTREEIYHLNTVITRHVVLLHFLNFIYDLWQCLSTAWPWHKLYRAARDSSGNNN